MQALQAEIARLANADELDSDARQTFLKFRDLLTRGEIRAAEKVGGEWKVNIWVKQGVLLGFRLGELAQMGSGECLSFVDKDTFPARKFAVSDRVRVVPGGSSVRVGVYEGTLVRTRAVLGAGVILTRSTPLYDLVRGEVYRATSQNALEVPEGAVVVPGSRAVNKGKAADWGVSLYAPVIVKYRDEKTEKGVELEEWLR